MRRYIDCDKYERCRDKFLAPYDVMDEWEIYEHPGIEMDFGFYYEDEYMEDDNEAT